MTTTTVSVLVPVERAAPRALAAIELALTFAIGLKRWIQLKREQRALMKDATELRRYADSLRHSDPSLAADLHAAVDRSI